MKVRLLTLAASLAPMLALASATVLPAAAQSRSYLVPLVTSTTGSITGDSFGAHISRNGRFVAFDSSANDLVTGVLITGRNVYRHDLTTRETVLVSLDVSGTGTGNDGSTRPFVSDDGRFLSWQSKATNLVPGTLTSGPRRSYFRDMETGTTTLLPEGFLSAMTPDGAFVVLFSSAQLDPRDTDSGFDLYRVDTATLNIEPISMTAAGVFDNDFPVGDNISDDGRFSVFRSRADNLVPGIADADIDVYLKDLVTGDLSAVSTGPNGTPISGDFFSPTISGDGSVVGYVSTASTLVPNDTNGRVDMFVQDLATWEVSRVNESSTGGQHSVLTTTAYPELSTDGMTVVFWSYDSPLVPGDNNNVLDIFRKNVRTGEIQRITQEADGGQLTSSVSVNHKMSGDGQKVVIVTGAPGVDSTIIGPYEPSPFVIDTFDLGIAGENFCSSEPNSTGRAGVIGAFGNTTAMLNRLSLSAAELPRSTVGFFLVSRSKGFVPLAGGSEGNLCLGGAIGRYLGSGQVANTGTAGRMQLQIDLTQVPFPMGSQVASAGESLQFQAWTRDLTSQGIPTSNMTNGVTVTLR